MQSVTNGSIYTVEESTATQLRNPIFSDYIGEKYDIDLMMILMSHSQEIIFNTENSELRLKDLKSQKEEACDWLRANFPNIPLIREINKL